MHRGLAVPFAAIVVVALAGSSAGCNKSSKSAKSARNASATTSTTGSSQTTRFVIPKKTFPPGQDPCKLTEAEVSAAAGFTVHKATPPNDSSCLYKESDELGAPSVYILWNRGTETRAKSDSVFSLGGGKPATVTDVSGFRSWAFTAFQELHDTVDGCVSIEGDVYFSTRIEIRAPGSNDLPARSVALMHKLAD
jgi:hypothetical protein